MDSQVDFTVTPETVENAEVYNVTAGTVFRFSANSNLHSTGKKWHAIIDFERSCGPKGSIIAKSRTVKSNSSPRNNTSILGGVREEIVFEVTSKANIGATASIILYYGPKRQRMLDRNKSVTIPLLIY